MTQIFDISLEKLIEIDIKKHPEINIIQIPFFIKQSIKAILRNGIDVEGIFRISGNKETIMSYYDRLNKGEEIDFIKEKANPNDVASLFKQFLRELPDPVLSSELYDKWIEVHNITEKATQIESIKKLIHQIPSVNESLLSFIISLMGKIAKNSFLNKMDSSNLSKTIGPNLLWKFLKNSGDSVEYLINSTKINDIINIMIENYREFWPLFKEEYAEWFVWDEKLFSHKKSVQYLINGYNDIHIWSCDSNGVIKIWDIENRKEIKEFDSEQGRLFTMSKIGTKQIWTASAKSAKIWDIQFFQCIKTIEGFTYCMTTVKDTIWVGSENKINIYSLNDELIFQKEIPFGKDDVILSLALDPINENVWAATTSKKIHIYNVKSSTLIKEITEGHKKKVNAFTVSKNNNIWSAGDDVICVWDCQTFNLLKRLELHQGAIYGIETVGDFIWSCSWDTTIKIWNSNTFELICSLENYHSDSISSVKLIWNVFKKQFEVWSSSWDKSICIFIVGPLHKLSKLNSLGIINNSMEELKINNDVLEEKKKNLDNRSYLLMLQKQEIQQKKMQLEEKKRELAEKKSCLEQKKIHLMELKKQMGVV
jgi:WD40 repeat protein